MRHRILLAALTVFSLGTMTACSSPPMATTHETAAADKLQKGYTFQCAPTPVTLVAVEPYMYSLTAPVILEPAKTALAVFTATSDLKPVQNSSRPLVGLAIARRVGKSSVINLIVAGTCGHKLLHVDPGIRC